MVIRMTNKKIYNFFLFLSTMTRSLVEVFSVILLYEKGYSVNNIVLFLLVMYLVGILVNYVSLAINYKLVLIVSILLYGGSYLFLSFMNNDLLSMILFGIILAGGSYSYHSIRHYLAVEMIDYDKGKNINIILVVMYVAMIVSNILGMVLINKLSIMGTSVVIMILSIISLIPIFKLDKIKRDKVDLFSVKIDKNKIWFSIMEQFKVIFMELQPLYIYLFVKASTYYVGIFNVIINGASLVFMLFISKRVNNKYFRYVNILFGVVLLLKLNIRNSIIMLGVAFLEGVFTKLYEKFSLSNLYDIGNNSTNSYLIVEEIIFFVSKSIMMLIFLLFVNNIIVILYICIIGIVISGFYIRDN